MIHVVLEGESIDSIASYYGISPYDLAFDNQIAYPYPLVIGQALWVNINTKEQEKANAPSFFGYAYPFIEEDTLLATLPYLRELFIFSYGFTEAGELLPIPDEDLIQAAQRYGVEPVLVLTPFSESGVFSNQLVNSLVENVDIQTVLVDNLLSVMTSKGYKGINIDFEYILPEDRERYVAFVAYVKERMTPYGFRVSVAVPPKIADDQPGLLYEGIDYQGLAEAADSIFLMTYEWGYAYGPPMAIAPIPSVRKVLDYAVTRIPREKIYMGLPNYAYDWQLPYERGVTRAETIGYLDAIDRALEFAVPVQYDEISMAPYIQYQSEDAEHVIWFEDVRSTNEKFKLIQEYQFAGGGYWNLMRFFRANWLLQANVNG